MTSETTYAALPVRQRGTLEIIDTALKLYRRYFGVLMGWSALVIFASIITYPVGLVLAYPLMAGVCSCAIAAAVRGQRISFGQGWEFSKPRYGALVLITFVQGLLLSAAIGVIMLLSVLVMAGGAWLLSAIGAPDSVSAIVAVIGMIIAVLVFSILSVLVYAWLGLAPIIACLEDDHRGLSAMSRAWTLMKGSWGRVLGLSTLLTIAVTAVSGIVTGTLALLGESLNLFSSNASVSSIIAAGLAYMGFFGAFFLFWNPIQNLILAVLYLDLRVRNEALDLEWSSYASTPLPVENNAVQAAPTAPELAQQLAANPLDTAPIVNDSPASLSAAPQIRPPAPTPPLNVTTEPVVIAKPPTPTPVPQAATTPEPFDFSSSFSAGVAPNMDEKDPPT